MQRIYIIYEREFRNVPINRGGNSSLILPTAFFLWWPVVCFARQIRTALPPSRIQSVWWLLQSDPVLALSRICLTAVGWLDTGNVNFHKIQKFHISSSNHFFLALWREVAVWLKNLICQQLIHICRHQLEDKTGLRWSECWLGCHPIWDIIVTRAVSSRQQGKCHPRQDSLTPSPSMRQVMRITRQYCFGYLWKRSKITDKRKEKNGFFSSTGEGEVQGGKKAWLWWIRFCLPCLRPGDNFCKTF